MPLDSTQVELYEYRITIRRASAGVVGSVATNVPAYLWTPRPGPENRLADNAGVEFLTSDLVEVHQDVDLNAEDVIEVTSGPEREGEFYKVRFVRRNPGEPAYARQGYLTREYDLDRWDV